MPGTGTEIGLDDELPVAQPARDEHVAVAPQPDVDGPDLELLLRVHEPDDVAFAERCARIAAAPSRKGSTRA